jgi:hypothetical protein
MTIEISDIQLFTLLKAKIGQKKATAIIEYVKQEAKASFEKTSQYLTKDISILQSHIDSKLEQTKTDLIKWILGLFMALVFMIVGIYIKK